MNKEQIINADALYLSMRKCSKGVKWKGTVAYYRHNWPYEISRLSKQLHDGTYKERKAKFFVITEPKRREIMSIHFRDRIFQRSLNDTGIYPQVTRSFIPDNFACQKGKGTDPARERLREFLYRYFRKYGNVGYVLKLDIEGYYPNLHHDFAEDMLCGYLDEETFALAKRVLSRLPGDVGYNPGSQIVQIVGITALDKIDHFIKEELRIKFYIRYMDDFILLHPDRKYLKDCLRRIEEMLHLQSMNVSAKKTFIQKISDPILFLGFHYRLTSSGKVVILADPNKIKHEHKKIMRMVSLVQKGELTRHDVDIHFKSYKACIRFGNSRKLIYRLNRWYDDLWKGVNYERKQTVYCQSLQDGYWREERH